MRIPVFMVTTLAEATVLQHELAHSNLATPPADYVVLTIDATADHTEIERTLTLLRPDLRPSQVVIVDWRISVTTASVSPVPPIPVSSAMDAPCQAWTPAEVPIRTCV